MRVGEKLAQFWNGIEGGYDHELFDDLWHNAYEGFSNSTGKAVSKTDLKSFMEKSAGVVTHSMETLYENGEVCVVEWKCTFPENSLRSAGNYTVIVWHKLKDGKIIEHRSGMTRIGY